MPAQLTRRELVALGRNRVASSATQSGVAHRPQATASILQLRSIARRYRRQMQREVEEQGRRLGREWAA